MQTSLAQALIALGAFAAFGFAAIGSAIGCGLAAASAIGSWKRCYAQGKPAPFLLVALAGSPLSQTIYGMILMMLIKGGTGNGIFYLALGVFAGIALMASAIFQGKAAAAGCDAFGETNKGFTNYLTICGIVETVALFALVFGIMVI